MFVMLFDHGVRPLHAGLTLGIVWGLGVFALGLAAWLLAWGVPAVELLGSLYLGFAPSFTGALVGLLWGAADGFVCGFVLAWVYNKVGVMVK